MNSSKEFLDSEAGHFGKVPLVKILCEPYVSEFLTLTVLLLSVAVRKPSFANIRVIRGKNFAKTERI
jgi:hypothetical protein